MRIIEALSLTYSTQHILLTLNKHFLSMPCSIVSTWNIGLGVSNLYLQSSKANSYLFNQLLIPVYTI